MTEEITSSMDEVRFTVEDFIVEDGSRTNINALGQFTWADGDTLGVFPEEGYQTAFPISAGAGTSTALFDGGQWALRANARYAAYYPFTHPMDQIQKTAIPVSYEGQTQNGNNSTAHLGQYDYIGSTYTSVNSSGSAMFSLKHVGAMVKFTLTMPDAASYTSMTLSTSAGSFATKATYSLSAGTFALTPTATSQVVELALKNISTTQYVKTLTLYMFMAPGNYSDKAFTITLLNSTNKYIATVTGKKFEAGKAYTITATCAEPVANHPYVDLGLPSGTLWATTNVGANNPEDAGDYFAWAETSPKTSYTWANYYYMNSGYTNWSGCSKYTFDDGQKSGSWYSYNGNFVGDNKRVLESMDDVATEKWGSEWKIPTPGQFEELFNQTNCTWTWTTSKGVNGYSVTSKVNGNSIFLPATGWYKGSSVENKGANGYFWSSSLSSSYSDCASYLFFYSGYQNVSYGDRANGLPVRPVKVQ